MVDDNFVNSLIYIIREKLRTANKLTKYSPMQMVKYLSRFRGVYVDGKWTRGEMTRSNSTSWLSWDGILRNFSESYS